jgi:hypothetical protein
MRDLVAGVVAIVLLVVAASLATTLQVYRRRRQRARDSERALGRTIIAEIPAAEDLVLFSEDAARFYYGEQSIDKDLIVAVRVLINGAPIAAYASRRHARGVNESGAATAAADEQFPATSEAESAAVTEDRPEGIARDRWDVAIETVAATTRVGCGAIRERVSQELARAVFDAVERELERRERTSRA